MIRLLNDRFVNTWVLKQELSRLQKSPDADARGLAEALLAARQPKSPVDCVVLSPQGKVLLVRPVHDLLSGSTSADNYRRFLEGAQSGATNEQPKPEPLTEPSARR